MDDVKIAYEYRNASNTHIVEVKPQSVFKDSKKYIDMELELEKDFSQQFPDQELLFISKDSLTEIKSPEIVLNTKFQLDYQFSNLRTPGMFKTSESDFRHSKKTTLPKAA